MLWGLGVGYVISGEYFGWNLGLPEGGTYGLLGATLIITLMYVCFVLSYAELACAVPKAGGAFAYALRSHGPILAYVAGFAQNVEFLFATPAIAAAIGAYFALAYGVSPTATAIGAFAVFTALNAWGVKQAAWFELFVTIAAVIELLIFTAVVLPHFDLDHFRANPLPNGVFGVARALPFAVWFYLAIEGVANVAEEARNPQRDLAFGFGSAMATLVVLAFLVLFAAVGVGGWEKVVHDPKTGAPSDSPLPLAIGQVVDPGHFLFKLLVTVGLLGLVASFHGIILAGARATFELGRSGFAPRPLGHANARTRTPVNALLANTTVGVVTILLIPTGTIITLSAFGALTLYIVAMLSLFRLRRREPDLERPFRAVGYPYVPAVALAIAAVSLAFMAFFNPFVFAMYILLALGGLMLVSFFS
jgi:ethanolamine permease